MPKVKYSVSAKSENDTKTIVNTPSGFEIIVDEPENQGGTNAGPNPVEYVLASLAGCINVVGHMIAKEKGINMEGINIKLEGDIDPAKFTGKIKEGRAGYQEIRVKVMPDCEANEEILQEWLTEVEERCPVSDTYTNQVPVKLSIE